MGRMTSNFVLGLACLFACSWIVLLSLPYGWHRKSTLILDLNVGLWQVNVEHGLGGAILAGVGRGVDKLAGKLQGKEQETVGTLLKTVTTGEKSLRYFRDLFCNLQKTGLDVIATNCQPWDLLMYGSWVMMISGMINVLLLFLGGAFYWHYWHEEARTRSREIAFGLFLAAPIVVGFGLIAYVALSFQFGQWLSGTPLTSNQSTYNFMFVSACVVWLFTWCPALIAWSLGGKHELEDTVTEALLHKAQYGTVERNIHEVKYGYTEAEQYDEYGNPVPGYPQQGQEYAQQGYSQEWTQQSYPQDPYAQQQQGYPQGQQQGYQQGQGQAAGYYQQY